VSKADQTTSAASGNQVRINRAFYIGIGLNTIFTVVEFAAGIIYDSLALLSDAVHNLSDVGSLVIALIAYRLSKVAPTKRFTFGFGKTTILASLINAIILLVVTGGIIREAILRFSDPRSTEGVVTIDAVVSLGVVVSGIIILSTGWILIDPLISMVIAVVIIASTWGLFRESLRLTTDAVPEGIDNDSVRTAIANVHGVKDVHHIHIWAISTTINSLTAHIVISSKAYPEDNIRIREEVRSVLLTFNISHATLELEPEDSECRAEGC
jgi:cobalt-zinc-cadmium efflux system protein